MNAMRKRSGKNGVIIVGAILLCIAALTGCNLNGSGEEESGPSLGLNEVYDGTRSGVRLILSWDESSNAFTGTVLNTTVEPLQRVRVEVHLSNGTELGPTVPVDLAPGEIADITLSAMNQNFERWTPHAEAGIESED
jgi:hypothetical protein